MPQPARTHVLLLPERRMFRGQAFSPVFARCARRFVSSQSVPGESAQLQRHFRCAGAGWPMAAICRQHEYADAQAWQWLRVEPLYLQVEMRGARIMASGGLAIGADGRQDLLAALRPVLGDYGFELSVSRHDYFYLRATPGSPMPDFMPAPETLGFDLAAVLPADKRWTAIFNECQIILHNHPLNVLRQRQAQLPINGLWFWGQGTLPAVIHHDFEIIDSPANDLQALASVARLSKPDAQNTLRDLRHVRQWSDVEAAFKPDSPTVFDFADGTQWRWQPNYRWHFWRRSMPRFD